MTKTKKLLPHKFFLLGLFLLPSVVYLIFASQTSSEIDTNAQSAADIVTSDPHPEQISKNNEQGLNTPIPHPVAESQRSSQPTPTSSHHQSSSNQKSAQAPNSQPQSALPSSSQPNSNSSSNSNPNPSSSSNPNSNPNSHSHSTPSPNPPSVQPTPTPQPTPVEDPNQILKQSIEKTYSISIFYTPEDIKNYQPGGRQAYPIQASDIHPALTELKTVLSRYPSGFFQEFRQHQIPLSFYLIHNVQNDYFAGYFDWKFTSTPKITLARKNLLFSFTANHEIMHAIDSFIDMKMRGKQPNNPYAKYSTLNPADFTYSNDNYGGKFKHYVLFEATPDQTYFASRYGQVNPREDRAEVFKHMMRDRNPKATFVDKPHLKAKAELISRQIATYFRTATPQAYWNRFLK